MKLDYFDRNKPFFPYVLNYISTLHGMLEMLSRAFIGKMKEIQPKLSEDQWLEFIESIDAKEDYKTSLKNSNLNPTLLLGHLSLKSEGKKSNIAIKIDELSSEFFSNHNYLFPFQLRAAGGLLVMCFEISKETYDAKDEMWNFFYHCRNAAAHGGEFNITNVKRFPAKWNNLEITPILNGSSLFKDDTGKNGILSPGDPIALVFDIEKQYM